MREDYVSNDEEGAARLEHDRAEAYGDSYPHPSRVTVSADAHMVTGLLPKCSSCDMAEGHDDGVHAGVRLDVTARQTRSKLLSGVARAYGAVPPPRDAQCLCGDGRGAHHGADGEGRCGETGCGCERFDPSGEEIDS